MNGAPCVVGWDLESHDNMPTCLFGNANPATMLLTRIQTEIQVIEPVADGHWKQRSNGLISLVELVATWSVMAPFSLDEAVLSRMKQMCIKHRSQRKTGKQVQSKTASAIILTNWQPCLAGFWHWWWGSFCQEEMQMAHKMLRTFSLMLTWARSLTRLVGAPQVRMLCSKVLKNGWQVFMPQQSGTKEVNPMITLVNVALQLMTSRESKWEPDDIVRFGLYLLHRKNPTTRNPRPQRYDREKVVFLHEK